MQEFDDTTIFTSTIVVLTNLKINLEWLYSILKVSDIDQQNTRIKTNTDFNRLVVSQDPPFGTITLIQHKKHLKGFKLKKRHVKRFRNSLSIVMYVGKLITIKVPSKGKIQMTGCITKDHPVLCIKYLWNTIRRYASSPDTYSISGDGFWCIIRRVMTDTTFKLGFRVNRQALDQYMNQSTEFNSLLETSLGYTGVNIKLPYTIDIDNTYVLRLENRINTDDWKMSSITYREYYRELSSKEVEEEMNKVRKNSFLVFYSGTVIMSGMSPQYMRDAYNRFVSLINNAREEIKEVFV